MNSAHTYTVGNFCAIMQDVAATLSLPGYNPSRSTHIAQGGLFSVAAQPNRVPDLALISQLMGYMPNPTGMDRNGQVGVANAVKGAVTGTGFEAAGRDLFLAWSAKWCGSDPVEDARIYDTLGAPKNDWSSLLRICHQLDPNLAQEVRLAEAKQVFSKAAVREGIIDNLVARNGGSKSSRALERLVLTPTTAPSATSIPPRQWLYGRSLIAGSLSIIAAPGGTGKSVLTMVEAVAMACGRTLLPGEAPQRPLRVWVHNAEDPQDELDRRLAAIMKQYGLSDADLGGRLFLTSGREIDLCLAKSERGEPRMVPGIEDKLAEFVEGHSIDVLVLDPLGAVHTLPENDNTAVNVLLGALRRIMGRTNLAIQAVHHTGKQAANDMKGSGSGAVRGASAWVDGARNVRQLARMTSAEATNFAIPAEEAFKYFRVDNGKANLAPAAKAVWRKIEPVGLGNGTPQYPDGDSVGVPVEWSPPTPMAETVTAGELQLVQAAIDKAPNPPRASEQSSDWVGYLVAGVLGLDVGLRGTKREERSAEQNRERGQVKGLVKQWLNSGGLLREPVSDPKKGRATPVIRTGQPAVLLPNGGGESACS
ncbi:AAA family ATPase [uncultured Shimia sp.]|uniref:AAA family ATPase n=1 Tax=uncultured Shimia sp. TaxID=573152 RepID=UPI00260D52BA|nr:AAA family ATPase [uncultured Shimia sp.]